MKFRHMTGIYLLAEDEILLLYRQGSRVGKDSWRGIGGHLEPEEIAQPIVGALRELQEETLIDPNDLQNLHLKYTTFRKMDEEVRVNYYFFAEINKEDVPSLASSEGYLEWKKIDESLWEYKMPYSAKTMLEHALLDLESLKQEQTYIGIYDGTKMNMTPMLNTPGET